MATLFLTRHKDNNTRLTLLKFDRCPILFQIKRGIAFCESLHGRKERNGSIFRCLAQLSRRVGLKLFILNSANGERDDIEKLTFLSDDSQVHLFFPPFSSVKDLDEDSLLPQKTQKTQKKHPERS